MSGTSDSPAKPALERAAKRRAVREAKASKDRYRKGGGKWTDGGFILLPWDVLDSKAYASLSYPARGLLLEVARQYHGDDNGRLLLSWRYLSARGWKSPNVIQRAKEELLAAGLIYQTVRGHRPNKASWFAVTWQKIDWHANYDAGATGGFVRGAYRLKQTVLSTGGVLETAPIDTGAIVGHSSADTGGVSIRRLEHAAPSTPAVHPLEVAISLVKRRGAA